MKNKKNLWILVCVIIAFTALYGIYSKPQSLNKIIPKDFEFVSISITEWIDDNRNISSVELSKSEFDEMIGMMMEYEYKKAVGRKHYFQKDDGDFYFIHIDCYDHFNNMEYTMMFTKDGYLEVDNTWYYLAEGNETQKRIVQELYIDLYDIRMRNAEFK